MEENQTNTKTVEKINPRPILNIFKGIMIFAIGYIWFNNYALGAILSRTSNDNTWIIGTWPGWVILGFCIWRGIISIIKRKKQNTSYLNFGIWAFILLASIVFVLFITSNL